MVLMSRRQKPDCRARLRASLGSFPVASDSEALKVYEARDSSGVSVELALGKSASRSARLAGRDPLCASYRDRSQWMNCCLWTVCCQPKSGNWVTSLILPPERPLRLALANAVRGGEYVLYDRASRASIGYQLPRLETLRHKPTGEAFERGYGEPPDFAQAAMWYLAAAEQQYARGALNLATLFERGLGLQQDPTLADYWYAQASQYALKDRLADVEANQIPPPVIRVIEPPLNQRGIKVESNKLSRVRLVDLNW